jgi:hypothetical protein
LTFRYDGDDVRLADRRLVRMIAPASVGPPPEAGKQSGSWVELRDDSDRLLFHRVLHDPFETRADHHSEEGSIEMHTRPPGSGEFDVILPALPNAVTATLWSSPPDPKLAHEPARELARVDLRDDQPEDEA